MNYMIMIEVNKWIINRLVEFCLLQLLVAAADGKL